MARPTTVEKKQTDTDLKWYFERNINEMSVVARTGHSWRTVHSRYEKWDKLLRDRSDKNFLDSQDRKKERAVLSLDKQLLELVGLQNDVLKIVSLIKTPNYDDLRPDIRAKLAWMIFDLSDRKASLEMTPSVASRVKHEVRELIEKYQKQPVDRRELEAGK